MARFNILSASTGAIKYSGAPTYHGTYLKPAYLEFTTISSPTLITWEVGDYVVYPRIGLTFRLYDIPQPTKKAASAERGESFEYSNVQFYADTKRLEIVPFRDLVVEQGTTTAYHFSTLNSVDTYENVAGICARIQKNMENFYGAGAWSFIVESGIPASFAVTEAREFSLSGGSCLDALDKIYEVWPELGWAYSLVNNVHTITVGAPNVRNSTNTTNEFRYGKGYGLTMIKKTQQNKDTFCTRLYAYGSSRNLITRYYNNKTIYQAANVYIPNLMIPLSNWGQTDSLPDASKAYLDASSAQVAHGIVPKIAYFDGSDQKEIYPSISETTIALLKSAKTALGKTGLGKPDYFPQSSDGTQRLDEIESVVSAPSDNGDTSDMGKKYVIDDTTSVAAQTHTGTAQPSGEVEAHVEFDMASRTLSTGGQVTVNPNEQELTVSCTTTMTGCTLDVSLVVGTRPLLTRRVSNPTVSGGVYTFKLPSLTVGDSDNPASGSIRYYIYVSAFWYDETSAQTVTVTNSAFSMAWKVKKALVKTFSVKLRQIGFDVMERAALSGNGNPAIAFKDGKCIAKSFPIKSATYNASDDSWTLVVYRGVDSSIGMMYPNTTYPVAAGDHFVLIDLAMPDEYVEMASSKLYAEAQALLAKLSVIEPFYEPSVNAKVVAQNLASHPADESYRLKEGKYMRITDSDVVGTDEYVIIDTLTINENESSIPTYKVTLREKKKESFTQSIESAIESLQSAGTTSLTSETDSSSGLTSGEIIEALGYTPYGEDNFRGGVDYPTVDGNGATGTWGIGITGNAATADYASSAGSASSSDSCSGNAATATKLKTARTIWGQNFDGSGNVSGAFSGATTGAFSSDVSVGGALTAGGDVTTSGKYYDSSDIRLKNILRPLDFTLEDLQAIPKIIYTWKKGGGELIGTIAQSIEEKFGQLISRDSDGYLSVDYDGLSVVALHGIDLLIKEINKLKEELRDVDNCK